jgi:hypothetical protein
MSAQTENGVAIVRSDKPLITGTQSALDLMAAVKYESGCAPDFTNTRRHHEIYLGDPRKTAPKKLRTVIRYPIRRA